MKKIITLLIITGLLIQSLAGAAGAATFSVLKIDSDNKIHLKDDALNKYYVISPKDGQNPGVFQTYGEYQGEYVNDSELKINDASGNSYTFAYLEEPPPNLENTQEQPNNYVWVIWVVGIAAVVALISSSMHKSSSSSGSSGSSGSMPSY